MITRGFVFYSGLFFLSLLCLLSYYCPDTGSKPNIVFIMADDLGYGHLGCYGQEIILTPNIDRLAAEGIRFTQAYAGCSVCAPSRNCLMTGQHSGHISVRGNGGGVSLQESDITIAQVLKKADYRTGLFGKWGLGEERTLGVPNNKGFDEFFGYLHQLHAQFYYPEFLWHNNEKIFFPENAHMKRVTYSPDQIMGRAFDFIRENKNQSFFLYLPVTIPHHEFIAPDEALKIYGGKFEESPIEHWRDGYALPREPKATFAAMVTHMDKAVGQLMTLLSQLQIDNKTIVFFVSDNGAAHGPLENAEFFKANGGLRDYKGSLYEGGIRIPMIVRWPDRIQAGSISDLVTYFPDILPTLADLAQVSDALPEKLDGFSIVPTLLDTEGQRQHKFLYWEDAEYDRTTPFGLLPETFMQAVRMGKWKGVKNSPDSSIELYDLHNDPGETKNLASDFPEVVKEIDVKMEISHISAPAQVDRTHEEAARLYIPRK